MKTLNNFIQEKFIITSKTRSHNNLEHKFNIFGKGNIIEFNATRFNSFIKLISGISPRANPFTLSEMKVMNDYIPDHENVYFIPDHNLPRNGKLVKILRTHTCNKVLGNAYYQCKIFTIDDDYTVLVHLYDQNNTTMQDTYIWNDVMAQ